MNRRAYSSLLTVTKKALENKQTGEVTTKWRFDDASRQRLYTRSWCRGAKINAASCAWPMRGPACLISRASPSLTPLGPLFGRYAAVLQISTGGNPRTCFCRAAVTDRWVYVCRRRCTTTSIEVLSIKVRQFVYRVVGLIYRNCITHSRLCTETHSHSLLTTIRYIHSHGLLTFSIVVRSGGQPYQ